MKQNSFWREIVWRAGAGSPAGRGTADRLALAAVIVSATAAAGCAAEAGGAEEQLLQTMTVGRATIVSSVDASGTVEPIRVIEVKSQAGGEILELPVELGDMVGAGTLLARIDPRDVNNAFDQAQADFDVAVARQEVSQRQLGRVEELHTGEMATDEELENAMLEKANAEASLVRARTNLDLARDKLNDVTLRAPITGTVVERTVEEGQVVTGTRDLTGGTVLMRMADLTEVQVRMFVDEQDIGRLNPGLPAEITVDAFPSRTFQGTVLKIEPQAVVQQNVTMFAVLTRIPNPDDLLRPGMNSEVSVVIGREENALSIGNSGIKTTSEAQQLVSALGIDLDINAAVREFQAREGGDGQSASDQPEEEEMLGGVPVSQLGSMSQSERAEWFGNLTAEERQRVGALMREAFAAQQGSARAQAANPAAPRPAVAFYYDGSGMLTAKPIMIGLSDFDNTHVLRGLDEGEEIVALPFSLVQQQEFLQRIRNRTRLPIGGG